MGWIVHAFLTSRQLRADFLVVEVAAGIAAPQVVIGEGGAGAEAAAAELEPLATGAAAVHAFAALVHDLRDDASPGVDLYWHTYNARPPPPELDEIDYRELPRAFHVYFEQDVQPLDRR